MIDLNGSPLVTTLGNRACLTDLVVADLPSVMRQWVFDNCEHDWTAEVWLLPIPKEDLN